MSASRSPQCKVGLITDINYHSFHTTSFVTCCIFRRQSKTSNSGNIEKAGLGENSYIQKHVVATDNTFATFANVRRTINNIDDVIGPCRNIFVSERRRKCFDLEINDDKVEVLRIAPTI